MATPAQHSRILISIGSLAIGILFASTLGTSPRISGANPSKASAGAFGTVEVDPGSVPPNSCKDVSGVAVPGIRVGDHVVVEAPSSLEADLIGTAFAPVADDLMDFRICNVTAAPIAGTPQPWSYMAIR